MQNHYYKNFKDISMKYISNIVRYINEIYFKHCYLCIELKNKNIPNVFINIFTINTIKYNTNTTLSQQTSPFIIPFTKQNIVNVL